MPNRKGHQRITGVAALSLIPASVVLPFGAWVILEAGCLITLIPELTPDLDISHRRFDGVGDFLGLKAYAETVPHRAGLRSGHWKRLSPTKVFLLSHIPLVGTLFRTFIVVLVVGTPFIIFGWMDPKLVMVTALWTWIGMSYSDLWHTVADITSMDFKHFTKSEWRNRRRFAKKKIRKSTKGTP